MMNTPKCYGTILPDLTHTVTNAPMKGHVFSALLKSAGMFVQERSFAVNDERWEKCTKCEHYRTCYDLSMGKFLVSFAIGETR